MATKFFSDGAVHAYFNPYETPYDAFMNYMNVLSDFEIRLRKLFPDTAEQDQIYKLGNQVIEKDMLIEKQVIEIQKLTKKMAKIIPVVKPSLKKPVILATKTTAAKGRKKDTKSSDKKKTIASSKEIVTKIATGKIKAKARTTKKISTPKSGKRIQKIKK
jgi:alpha-amylase